MHRSLFLVSFLVLIVVPACSNAPSNMGDPDAAMVTDTGIGSVDSARPDDTGGPVDGGRDAFASPDASGPDAGPIVDGGGTLAACGGRTGHTCTATEYCDYEGAPCGTTDGSGVCRARPDRCAPDTTMVCGCDGITYANACGAAMAGTDVSSSSACAGSTFACGSISCQTGVTYCQVTMGGPPPGHTSYACQPLPAACAAGSATPTCAACFGAGSSSCVDGNPGEITVTRLTP